MSDNAQIIALSEALDEARKALRIAAFIIERKNIELEEKGCEINCLKHEVERLSSTQDLYELSYS